MASNRPDPGPFRSKKYLCKLLFDDYKERHRNTKTLVTDDKIKALFAKRWEDWELRGDGQLICDLLAIGMLSEKKAEEEFKDARLRRRLYKSKERLRCRSKKSVTETSSGTKT